MGFSLESCASLLDIGDADSDFLACASDWGHAGDAFPLDSVSC